MRTDAARPSPSSASDSTARHLTQRFSSLSAARSGSTPPAVADRSQGLGRGLPDLGIEVGKEAGQCVDRFRAVVLSARAPACLTLLSASRTADLHSGKSRLSADLRKTLDGREA